MGERRGTKALETWCKRVTQGYPGVKVENMTTSWRDGMAFCAMIHHFRPDLIDFSTLDKSDILRNNEMAFRIAERHLGIPALLDAEDMAEYPVPDRLSILTYLSQFYQAFASNSASPIKKQSSESPDTSLVGLGKVKQSPKMEGVPTWKELCFVCNNTVFLAQRLRVEGHLYHRTCFRCARCNSQLSPSDYYETYDGNFCCETCPDEIMAKNIEDSPPVSINEDIQTEPPSSPQSKTSLVAMRKRMFDSYDKNTDDVKLTFEDTDNVNKETINDLSFNSESSSENHFIVDEKSKDSHFSDSTTDSYKFSNNLEIKNVEKTQLPLDDPNIGDSFKNDLENNPNIGDVLTDDDKKDNPNTGDLITQNDPYIGDALQIVDNTLGDKPILQTDGGKNDDSGEKILNVGYVLEVNNESESILETENDLKSNIGDDLEVNNKNELIVKTDEPLEVITPPKRKHKKKLKPKVTEYPVELNPFDEDEDDKETESKNPFGSESEEETPQKSLNPFGSDEDDDEKIKIPTPLPRRSLPASPEPTPLPLPRNTLRGSQRSINSLASVSSSMSTPRKKRYAPPPPSSSSPSVTSSPYSTLTRQRKNKRAPLPPGHTSKVSLFQDSAPSETATQNPSEISKEISGIVEKINEMVISTEEVLTEQEKKDNDSFLSSPSSSLSSNFDVKPEPVLDKKIKDSTNLHTKFIEGVYTIPKSSYGQWKKKKAPAPAPLIKRQVKPMPISNIKQALNDIEVKQQGLERQGVNLENKIRDKFDTETSISPYVEELVMQLFELVNEKNELFREQAELMYLRRQHHLEEEHAELEYQIRCLMARPESNKTDSDKELEEQLIKRLVDVVERRNAIVQCLESDRIREAEEDKSIHTTLGIYNQTGIPEHEIQKRLTKRKEYSSMTLEMEKNLDETGKNATKKKKKWYTLKNLKKKL